MELPKENLNSETENAKIDEASPSVNEVKTVEKETASAETENGTFSFKNNKKASIMALIAAMAVILGIAGYYIWKGTSQSVAPTGLTPEAASKIALDYVNKYFASTENLASISQISREKTVGLYKFTLELQGQKLNAYVSSDGKMFFPQDPIDLTKSPEEQEQEEEESSQEQIEEQEQTTVEGNFKEVAGAQVCQENGKPVVYFFGSTGCPHCVWEKPVIAAVAEKFGSAISYHENVDSQTDMDIFSKYSTQGYIPAIVIGCKYYRVGSGESSGQEAETAALTKLICNATNNQPAGICGQ
ncbi:MAG: thioredoxin family protein [Candidatus Paceibacterota bacterium]|jgi:thiol-disulfide isomerase/thioredoxin